MDTRAPNSGKTFPLLFDFVEVDRTRDLWASLWEVREQQAFEKALGRIVEGEGPRRLRLEALAACHVIATPAMLEVAQRAVDERWFSTRELEHVTRHTLPLYRLHQRARLLRGHRPAVQLYVELYLGEPDHPVAGPLLDVIDVCDLYLVNQAAPTLIALEAARRILSRGPHQRRRLARSLGVAPSALASALVPPAHADSDDEYVDYQVEDDGYVEYSVE
jgi:hypothetical protein